MAEGPCKNRSCKSFGSPHPNCQCYGMAKGGEVGSFCDKDQEHKPGCKYANGGKAESDGFQLKEESDTHYTLKHPSGDELKIAKKGISKELHGHIKKMAEGGKVDPDVAPKEPIKWDLPDVHAPYQGPSMAANPTPPKEEKKYADGGEVQKFDDGGQAQPAPPPATPPAPATIMPPPGNLIPGANTAGLPDAIGQMQQATGNISTGIEQQAAAEKAIADKSGNVYDQQAKEAQRQSDNIKYANDAITSEQMKLADELTTQKVDFNRVWHLASTPKQITAALGIALGQVGSGLTHSPNAALGFIDNIIARDVDAQKQEIGNKKTALSAYNDVLQNKDHAAQLMHTLGLTATIAQLNKITAGQGSQLAQSKANMLKGQLLPQLQMQTYNLAIQRANAEMLNQPEETNATGPQKNTAQSDWSNAWDAAGKSGAQLTPPPHVPNQSTGAEDLPDVDLRKLRALQYNKIIDTDKSNEEVKNYNEYKKTRNLLMDDLNGMADIVRKNRPKIAQSQASLNPLPTDPLGTHRMQEFIGNAGWGLGKPISENLPAFGGKVQEQYDALSASAQNKINTLLSKRNPEALKNIRKQLPDRENDDETMAQKANLIRGLVDSGNDTPILKTWQVFKHKK